MKTHIYRTTTIEVDDITVELSQNPEDYDPVTTQPTPDAASVFPSATARDASSISTTGTMSASASLILSSTTHDEGCSTMPGG